MSSTLTDAGLTTPSLDEIKEAIESDQRANISPALDQSPASPLGQTNAIVARQIRLVWEVLQAIYSSMDPDAASGVQLDHLAALTGTVRRPATASRVEANVTVDPGTYATGALVAYVTGNPNARFSNVDPVVNSGGSSATITATFESETTGPIAAPAGTLTEIASPVTGWSSINNLSDAKLGSDVESDAGLRARRTSEVQAQGSTTVDAIRADISQNVSGVLEVSVLENTTDSVDANNLDPHSIEVIAYGPASPTAADDAELANQIFRSKPAGCATSGISSVSVTDSQGYAHEIKFTRPTALTGWAVVILEYDPDLYPGDSEAKDLIAASAASELAVGQDLDWSDIVSWAMAIPGVIRVTSAGAANTPPVVSWSSLPADIRQIVTLPASNIDLTSSVGTP